MLAFNILFVLYSSEPSGPGGSVASPPRDAGGVRRRRFGGSMGLPNGSCSSRMGEKPISKVLESGQDEIGAGEGAVAVTVTPDELERSSVIGQVWQGGADSDLQTRVFKCTACVMCNGGQLMRLPKVPRRFVRNYKYFRLLYAAGLPLLPARAF